MSESSSKIVRITKVASGTAYSADDFLAVEEPLEISIRYGKGDSKLTKNVSVTMRTPGNDTALALGFLFTEGIIKSYSEVAAVRWSKLIENKITIELDEQIDPEISKLERNFYTTSSCGVCGKSSIESIRVVNQNEESKDTLKMNSQILLSMPDFLRKQQEIFDQTGGLHASALFDLEGNLILLKEDVGRHNALDKLIGESLLKGMIPLNNYVLLLSGRASFELIQKAVMAGIKIIAAVGAPSSLAVELAEEFGVTLIGFLRDKRFNIYSGGTRLISSA